MEAILLCGGLGTRLRSVVSDRPKPMADIAGKPFLHYLVKMLSESGVKHLIFALGYMGEQIEAYFQSGEEYGLSISYSYEDSPLGTGGAIRNALSKVSGENVLVLNADTYFHTDYESLLREQIKNKVAMTIASRKIEDISRYGAILKDESGRILRWNEKMSSDQAEAPCPGEINGGIYVMQKSLIEKIPEGKQSLENDCIPAWLEDGLYLQAVPSDGYFMDIGIPEDYAQFKEDVESGKC
ncbi:nucleotidyltransferase family protein [Oribacterium asaccharolyticum]|uniref:nucleotidyltransferase family protein n=1 Tax=Oribacterium asaccharolyticum TaxID=1501332 RepID=UPI0028E41771|nr:nucleotidyltransferase family protein [Oribacterium asaccharolyticum]